MNKKIGEEELAALSELTGIAKTIISKMHKLQLLDISGCKKLLIRNEFQVNIDNNIGRKGVIITLLADKYKISRSLVEHIIYNKNANTHLFCRKCGAKISKYISKKNNGNCNVCKST
ncbi:hypothetical protein [Dysgonomonas sp. 511]|uniref:hypothetical protein n=1 Tax=Dysgonomonas sp. 511 TaxID=2302930 RepID=UPI0013D3DB2E|nr:hypothetical protein [Dysgonomonas sp. 511]NDV80289.1 hypothetical protein [Dysgonomonas sp. 511]